MLRWSWRYVISHALLVYTGAALAFWWNGCSTSRFPSSRETYGYRAITDNCDCEEYVASDRDHKIVYRLRARYSMEDGISTVIDLEVSNNTADTVFFDHGTVKISSINIAYQYNDKPLPLGNLIVPPHDTRTIQFAGNEVTGQNNWNKIAGEQLTVVLHGIRLGAKELRQQSVTFVPINPMLK